MTTDKGRPTYAQNHFSKEVKTPLPSDLWSPGAPQPGENTGRAQEMIVSKKYTAWSEMNTIERREQWLREVGLPLNIMTNNEHKKTYHNKTKQRRGKRGLARVGTVNFDNTATNNCGISSALAVPGTPRSLREL